MVERTLVPIIGREMVHNQGKTDVSSAGKERSRRLQVNEGGGMIARAIVQNMRCKLKMGPSDRKDGRRSNAGRDHGEVDQSDRDGVCPWALTAERLTCLAHLSPQLLQRSRLPLGPLLHSGVDRVWQLAQSFCI